MGWFSFLTGESKTAEKMVDGVSNGLDAMFFTDEERSVANQKILDFKLEYAKATQGQSLARRMIAFAVTVMWLICVMLLVIMGLWLGKNSAQVDWLLTVLKDVVNDPFMIIMGFYFLAHVVGSARK